VAAPASVVFSILADPRSHPLFDGSGTVRGRIEGPARLTLGSRFRMRMRWGIPYLITNTVVEFTPDALIAWRHFARHRWRYEVVALDDAATEVTETFDWGCALVPGLYERFRAPAHNARAIERTLPRLAALAETRAFPSRN
jgi:hypothetical protein